ncbi:MAG TPA: hypothetical protein VEO56_02180 [Bacteroidota bacterium]|nr:hypothetical protein [Bacteroidota bacterium]
MKMKEEKNPPTDEAERALVGELKALAGEPSAQAGRGPQDPYWANLIVRTNQRIDRATSPRALSISWAARVAIPGVVAIVSFLVALHYYVPGDLESHTSVTDVLRAMPVASVDSLLVDPSRADPSLSVADVAPDVFVFSNDQIADYLSTHGSIRAAIDGLSDREPSDLITALGSDDN